jgi:cytochrome o ubiquinol oxidase operon protein cyoD
MIHRDPATLTDDIKAHRALISYAVGFISSIILTLVAFALVEHHAFSAWIVAYLIGALALIQCGVQLYFFLHIGQDSKPRWKLATFLSMLIILCIVVFGSLWIMGSLNYRMMMNPEQMTKYMKTQVGL